MSISDPRHVFHHLSFHSVAVPPGDYSATTTGTPIIVLPRNRSAVFVCHIWSATTITAADYFEIELWASNASVGQDLVNPRRVQPDDISGVTLDSALRDDRSLPLDTSTLGASPGPVSTTFMWDYRGYLALLQVVLRAEGSPAVSLSTLCMSLSIDTVNQRPDNTGAQPISVRSAGIVTDTQGRPLLDTENNPVMENI